MLGLEDENLIWYKQPKSNTSGFKLSSQYDNISITSAPMMDGLEFEIAKKFNHYVNVSSTPFELNSYNKELDSQFHWFPMSELGFVGFNTLYGFIKTMDKIWTPENKIMLHCEAGCNRSPTMSMLWLMYKNNNDLEKAKQFTPLELDWDEKVTGNIEQGLLPELKDLKLFYDGIKKDRYLDDILYDDTKLGDKYLEYNKK